MVKNPYPLPLILEIMDKLKGAKYFTKLDVHWGYNNVQIRKGDKWKAAFEMNKGLFEPTMMFFGMCNSLATFQAMMDNIFMTMIDNRLVIVYMDNILIFADTKEELEWITKLVLEKLREHDLFLKAKKCKFCQTRIKISRHDHWGRKNRYGLCQVRWNKGLASSYYVETDTVIPWIWKLLSKVYFPLLWISSTSKQSDKEGQKVWME
jgi:Reverse transcriptase (RNA-dependent DNA polymerase)